ncbi:hypothetical protein QWJ07_34960, partial [Frankia sp. RB7]|nr:hypothetical protein [Frankia sp. RB7]
MRKLGVIVFGASVFEYHDDLKNPRFANSAREFKKTIVDSTILADFETETLDLYNKSLSVSETLDRIHDFVGREFDDIIAYYCGHGDVGLRDGDYGVFLRRSNRERRHTLINFPSLIKGIKRTALRKRVYFILDACYAGSAVSEMETMDAGGTEALIGRRLMETVQDNGSGTAVLAASGRFGAALAKTEDRLTLFTGAFIKCLQEGIAHKTDAPAFSWLDIKDEVVRATQDRLGPNAPIPTLMSYSDSASDITRTSFFSNRAFVPRADGGKDGSWTTLDDRVTEHLYWKSISDESPVFVLEDFLTKFPNGIFSKPARAFLLRQIKLLDEKAIEEYLLDHPRSAVLETLEQRLGTLKWSRLKDGTELAEIEQFVRRFTRSEFVVDASLLIASIRTAQVHQRPPLDIASANSALSDALKAPIEDLKVANSPDMKEPASGEITQPLLASTERNPTKGILSRGGILLAAFVITLLVGLAGKFYSDGTDTAAREAKFSRDLAMAGNDVSTLKRIVDDCKKASCAVLSEASRRLADAQAAVEAAAREQQFRNDLAAAGTDVPKLKRLVDDCKKASCAVLSEANRRLADAQAAVEAAA